MSVGRPNINSEACYIWYSSRVYSWASFFPFFLLIYINDLPECLNHATPRLFADDTNLTVAGECIQEIESNI